MLELVKNNKRKQLGALSLDGTSTAGGVEEYKKAFDELKNTKSSTTSTPSYTTNSFTNTNLAATSALGAMDIDGFSTYGGVEEYKKAFEQLKNGGTGYGTTKPITTTEPVTDPYANLNQSYQTQADSLTADRDSAIEQYKKAFASMQQQAFMNNEVLKKYLPQQLNAAGLGNLGTSQSAYLQLNNDYQNNLAGLSQDYNSNVNSTLDAYRRAFAELEANTADKRDIIQKEQNTLVDNKELEALANGQNILQMYYDALTADGKLDDNEKSELQKIADQYIAAAGSRGNEVQNIVDAYLAEFRNIKAAEQAEKVAPTDVLELGQFRGGQYNDTNAAGIISNKTYTITSNNPVSVEALKQKAVGFIQGKKQTARINAIIQAAQNGTLKDGEVVDINAGFGSDRYVYLNGKFYPVK